MAVGFGSSDCHLDTIQSTVDNGVDFSRSSLYKGVSSKYCLDCDEEIPEKRRNALVVHYCIKCQTKHEKRIPILYNRRGSKDSQLR